MHNVASTCYLDVRIQLKSTMGTILPPSCGQTAKLLLCKLPQHAVGKASASQASAVQHVEHDLVRLNDLGRVGFDRAK